MAEMEQIYEYWIEAIVAQDLSSLVRLSEEGAPRVPQRASQVSDSCARIVLADVHDYSGASTWKESFLCDVAAYQGSADIMEWFLADPRLRKLALRSTVFAYAAKGGHIHTLELLRDHGANMTHTFTYDLAARQGHVAALDWLLENQVPCDGLHICKRILRDCDFDILRWFVERGRFPLNGGTMTIALAQGYKTDQTDTRLTADHMDYLHSHGAPWDNFIIGPEIPFMGDRPEVLRVMWEHYAPIVDPVRHNTDMLLSDYTLEGIFAWLPKQGGYYWKAQVFRVAIREACPWLETDDEALRLGLLDRILHSSKDCRSCKCCAERGTNIKGDKE
jgi:hypothetical protein